MFGNAPFAVGSIVGWRTFEPSSENNGFLVGPMYPQNYVPGENRAFCLHGRLFSVHDNSDQIQKWNRELVLFGRAVSMPPSLATLMDNHCANIGCNCGFYCYWDNEPGTFQHHWNAIDALVEGWGHVTYGDRGFRCSKMKIIGLVKPDLTDEKPKRWLSRGERTGLVAGWVLCGLAAAGLFNIGLWPAAVVALLPAITATVTAVIIRHEREAVWRETRRTDRRINRETWDRIVARYPDAQVFESLAEAKRVFPPTNPFAESGQ